MHKLPESSDGTPAVLYGAKSTEDRHQSIPTQIDEAREMAAENGWTVVAQFTDEGFSAYSGNRGPGLQAAQRAAAQAAAEHGRPCMLIAQAHDRFARGAGDSPGAPQHLVELWTAMRRLNVHLRTVEDDFDMRDIGSVAAIGQRAMMDSRRKSKATRKGVARRAESGKPWGANAAYGYQRGPDGHWTPHPDEAPILERIFRERLAGGTYSGIAKALNAEGVPTRQRGANWSTGLTRKMLAGRYALGEFFHKGEWIKGSHPPLIDEATWEAAQALAAMGARYAPSRGGRRPHLHLFTNGLLRCSVCFEAMLPRSDGDRYACRTNVQLAGAGACSMPHHKREDVDRAGLEMFERAFLDLDATREHVATDLAARLDEIDAQHRRAAREVTEKIAARRRVENDYLAGDLGAGNYERLSASLDDEITAAEAERDRLAANAETVRGSRAELDADGHALRRLIELRDAVLEGKRTAEQTADVDALRRALATAFNAVYLSLDGRVLGVEQRARRDRTGPEPTASNLPPALRSHAVPVALPTGRTTQHGTFVSKYMTQKTLRPL